MLPTFLGIGAPKAGSTWLHEMLASHPHVFVPTRRKEIRYFSLNFQRGQDWYEGFFPSEEEAERYQAIGEFSPHYLSHPQCPERIADTGAIDKFIIILRNPAHRAYSHYKYRAGMGNFHGSFDDYAAENPEIYDWSFYARGLRQYLKLFDRDQFLILLYEEAIQDVPGTKRQLADFLGLDAALFPAEAGTRAVNASYIPRFRWAYATVRHLSWRLRKLDLDWLPNLALKLGLRRLFGKSTQPSPLTPLTDDLYHRLMDQFADDIDELEALLGRNLDLWERHAVAF